MRFARARCALLAAGVFAIAAFPAASQDAAPADPDDPRTWAKDLDSGDRARIEVAYRRFKAGGREGIPALIELVSKGNDRGASHACVILAAKGLAAVAAIPAIEDAISKRDVGFVANAVRALWTLGARPEKCLPTLQALAGFGDLGAAALVWRLTGKEGNLRKIVEGDLNHPTAHFRRFAAEVLEEFGPVAGKEWTIPLALRLSSDADIWVRARGLCVLTAVDPAAPESIAAYERATEEEAEVLRYEAVRGFAARGLSAPGAIAAIVRPWTLLKDQVAGWALGALLSGSRRSKEQLIEELQPLMESGHAPTRVGAALIASPLDAKSPGMAAALADGIAMPELRRACLRALWRLKELAAPAAARVAPLLRDTEDSVSGQALEILLACGAAGSAAAPEVAVALEDPRPLVRQSAANLILVVYGTGSVPDLEERLKGLDPAKYPEAARVLRKVRGLPDDAPPVPKRGKASKGRIEKLLKELREASLVERQIHLREIALIGPDAAAALPLILETIDSTEPASKRAALIALAAVAPTDPKTVDKIGPYLIGSDAQLKSAAVQALASLGPHQPRAAVVYLLDSVERDPDLRLEAAMALARIGAAAVDFLRARLGHEDPEARLWFVRSLGEIGPAAKDAIPDLEKTAADPDTRVKDAAAKALKKIRGN